MSIVSIDYIELDEKGIAKIRGKRSKVIQIVMDKVFHEWSAEQIHEEYPHLSLSEIYAAFSYYYDHKEILDSQIEESVKLAENMRLEAGESSITKKLKASGKLK